MSKTRTISRWTLSRRLQELALRIAAGKPVKVNGVSVVVPDRVTLETELESDAEEHELELEISWPAAPISPVRGRRRKKAS